MVVLGALPHYYFFGATSLAAVSLLLERGPLPFFTVKKKRPDSLFHENLTIKLAWRQRTWRKNVKWIKYSNGSQTICPEGFLGRAQPPRQPRSRSNPGVAGLRSARARGPDLRFPPTPTMNCKAWGPQATQEAPQTTTQEAASATWTSDNPGGRA